ncbi:TRAP transporter small permease [Pseudaminobacter sp. 19-2017]|uniref:TRAP transporter small permease protein n=1 Tax=Pseudaminobacter soli (ex Zhang et al. 2022) TaxID=2831468 RepID=A0A942E5U5_9HYPH|nr:TRAP transporter small permease [Pseudaminobacter soli]MBS3651775.1 TRAP transporter small permease [Pseudaminobacter soli]
MAGVVEAGEGPAAAASRLERIAGAISWISGVIAALLIVIVLAITALSVFKRYVLGHSLLGVDEATGFLVVAIVMAGAAEAYRRGDHIGIDLLLENVGSRTRWLLDLWADIAVLVFSVLLLVTAWHTVAFSRQFGAYSSGYLELPMWIPQSTMLLGAALLGLVSLAKIIGRMAGSGR